MVVFVKELIVSLLLAGGFGFNNFLRWPLTSFNVPYYVLAIKALTFAV